MTEFPPGVSEYNPTIAYWQDLIVSWLEVALWVSLGAYTLSLLLVIYLACSYLFQMTYFNKGD